MGHATGTLEEASFSLEVVPVERPPADGATSWARHRMAAMVHGQFMRWRGSLVFDARAPESSRLQVEMDAASIDTDDSRRDAHLRSAEFFDVEKYPKLVFRSTKVDRDGGRLQSHR